MKCTEWEAHWRGRCRRVDCGHQRGKDAGGGCSSTHLATSETEYRFVSPSVDWYRRVGNQPGERLGPVARLPVWERGRWGHRGGGLGRPRGPGQGTRGMPNPGYRKRDWGGRQWDQEAQGQRWDPRKGIEDRESDRGCQRREWRQCAGQRQCGCDNERERWRDIKGPDTVVRPRLAL
jgi:hypothetical protein